MSRKVWIHGTVSIELRTRRLRERPGRDTPGAGSLGRDGLEQFLRGVDIPTKAELYKLIVDLAAQGLGVLVVSSELEELVGISTRILVMRDGQIEGEERRR